MRKIALLSAMAAAAMAFANVSSASALSWSPQGEGWFNSSKLEVDTLVPRFDNCDSSNNWTGKASGAVIGFTNSFVMHCWDFTGHQYGAGSLSTQGQWSLTATSTSTATLKADTSPSGGTVLTVKSPGATLSQECVIKVKGPLTITGLPYNNATKTLTLNNTVPVASKAGWCTEVVGSTLTLRGNLTSPFYTILP